MLDTLGHRPVRALARQGPGLHEAGRPPRDGVPSCLTAKQLANDEQHTVDVRPDGRPALPVALLGGASVAVLLPFPVRRSASELTSMAEVAMAVLGPTRLALDPRATIRLGITVPFSVAASGITWLRLPATSVEASDQVLRVWRPSKTGVPGPVEEGANASGHEAPALQLGEPGPRAYGAHAPRPRRCANDTKP